MRALPLRDLRGMDFELFAQLGHRLVFAQGGQSYTGLERGRVRAPGASRGFLYHQKLLIAEPFSAQLHGRSFHLSRCSDLRSHFCGVWVRGP